MNDESTKNADTDGMRAEYDFDYTKSSPNRFAKDFQRNSVAVVLDPDVAEVFGSSESLNTFLRSVISAFPSKSSTGR